MSEKEARLAHLFICIQIIFSETYCHAQVSGSVWRAKGRADKKRARRALRCKRPLATNPDMNTRTLIPNGIRTAGWVVLLGLATIPLAGQTAAELRQRVTTLETELAEAKRQLAEAEAKTTEAEKKSATAEEKLAQANDTGPGKIEIGPIRIGGAIRANYALGNYDTGEGPTRGAKGGNFALDTFRINVDFEQGPFLGKLEYRWYNGYNFLHTGWLGYKVTDDSTVQVGANRVPFGPGPYGVSNSWFFDQHYYVGLSDDMDLGVKYTGTFGDFTLDAAYYFSDEGNWMGASTDSARYSYDAVLIRRDFNGDGMTTLAGFAERHQFNLRGVYSMEFGNVGTDVGASLQYGQLDAHGTSDGDAWAGSVHMKNSIGPVGIATQLTYYNFDLDDDVPWGNAKLIPMGAYDFAEFVAAEAFIPAIAVNYFLPTDSIDWLDSVNFYVEYSSIIKDGEVTLANGDTADFEDSQLFIIGAAWARGGWYVYTDLAFSDGNYFVGLDDYTTFGANLDATWQTRFNVNFGYYF